MHTCIYSRNVLFTYFYIRLRPHRVLFLKRDTHADVWTCIRKCDLNPSPNIINLGFLQVAKISFRKGRAHCILYLPTHKYTSVQVAKSAKLSPFFPLTHLYVISIFTVCECVFVGEEEMVHFYSKYNTSCYSFAVIFSCTILVVDLKTRINFQVSIQLQYYLCAKHASCIGVNLKNVNKLTNNEHGLWFVCVFSSCAAEKYFRRCWTQTWAMKLSHFLPTKLSTQRDIR